MKKKLINYQYIVLQLYPYLFLYSYNSFLVKVSFKLCFY